MFIFRTFFCFCRLCIYKGLYYIHKNHCCVIDILKEVCYEKNCDIDYPCGAYRLPFCM